MVAAWLTWILAALATEGCTGSIAGGGMGPQSAAPVAGGGGGKEGAAILPGAGGAQVQVGGLPAGVGGAASGNGTGAPIAAPGAGGSGGANGVGAGGVTIPDANAPIATPTLSRLSQSQWANSVRDLLLLPNPGDLTLPTADAVVRLDNEADSLFVNQPLHDDLQAMSERLAAEVAADATAIARLVPTSAPSDSTGRATAFIQTFGRRAFRRPLTAAEVQTYLSLFNQGPALTTGLETFAAGVRVTLDAILQSPHFLYRTGFGDPAVRGKSRLNDYEIAANLSYALTNSLPDAPLSTAADTGALKSSAAVLAQAKRLIATTAGKAAVDRFYFQFFGLGQYDTMETPAVLATKVTGAIGPLLHTETQQFLQYIFSKNGTLRDIFTSPVSFVNGSVASLYGLKGTFAANTWTQVDLDPIQRPGVLTRMGFLSYYKREGSLQDSIHRGVYINNRLLCKEMSTPPGLVLPTLPSPIGTNQTNRQIITAITGLGTCGGTCHGSFINPAGFAFENFDGMGNYQTMENGQVVDSAGEYPFPEGTKTFKNAAEFSTILAESQQLHACYATSWTAYLYSRVPRAGDLATAAIAAQSSHGQNLSSVDLILALISDDAFSTRVEAR